ncbi:MAG: hypothetical protein PVF45_11120 [Anaerolineae bacterium]|jgi:SAM-dependent methyltransferase
MGYRKLTKRQRKDRDRVLAWLDGEPFKENSRARAFVPDLGTLDVLDQYVPPDVTGAGQFFTPLETAQALVDGCGFELTSGMKVLDPCAGVGHLFRPFRHYAGDGVVFDAFEMEEECARIGAKLFPWVDWFCAIPFDAPSLIEGVYDLVVMNPPFGTRRGMAPGDRMCEGRCSRSEHIFLELAVRALKPDGHALILAPYNYLDRLPKAARKWVDERVRLVRSFGPLPGVFKMTKVKVHAFYFRRLGSELDLIYQRTSARQNAPDGVMTRVKQEWERINGPGQGLQPIAPGGDGQEPAVERATESKAVTGQRYEQLGLPGL